ncbi:MAG TPA: CDP-alcohol phosphatidyltransferase family protein [Paracoccaceae bacterium]|nr:CDP-alcohol phosphatidyltransferase family protein [Paracoccaceae bacterium]
MEQRTPPITACVLGSSATAPFGLDGPARLKVQLQRIGFRSDAGAGDADILLSGDCAFGNSVLTALAEAAPGTLLADNRGRLAAARGPVDAGTAAAIAEGRKAPGGALTGTELAGRYDAKLRKRADPMVMRLDDRAAAERALYGASYKGVTDVVTKYVWPEPALIVTRWCAAAGITPNQVTFTGAALMAVAFWLFWNGHFGIGLAAAWAMTFLDTVDGKLARVTLNSSKFGDVLDHGIDLVHPPFWYWAWAVGCAAVGLPLEHMGLVIGAIVGGYVLQRGEEAIFVARWGMHIHVWQRFDSLFRLVTARRNPNLVILTVFAALNAPRAGLIAVAVWTVLCLVIHAVRIVQAFAAARRGPIVSWLAGS